MASTAVSGAGHSTATVEKGDLFNSPLVWLVIVLMTLLTIATVIGFGFIYYGDDVQVPAWDERSVPRPTTAP